MKRSLRMAAATALASGVVAGGIYFVASAGGDPSTPPAPPSTSEGVNSNGERFGSAGQASSDAELPDLIAVIATNGKYGFVKKSDYLGGQLTLEQVEKLPKSAQENAQVLKQGPRAMTVYASDGTTKIGEFVRR